MKILIIDDNPGILFTTRKGLEFKKHDVYTNDVYEGVDAIREIGPELIFLDVGLSGENGCVVCRELKNHPDTQDIPVVLVTGYSDTEALVREAEADDYLLKPFSLVSLWEMVEKYV